ncbi:ScbR family autoregulator-binding transcription factor [Streptomyces sp. WAC06614]|uniref:ScbR family autoregulator-binding transcription factor n=1 Tax=Streptomyces sp. WAC06614 TaxID=2487416 RepID=UPI000F774AB2|nr:ScbR family autoregulator-binding transcription factor [Streptomyces sp. WAC06614]RSS83981.1 TetR/AcrR family transcriptional regulator [Streptomyces sp. WAC06614]
MSQPRQARAIRTREKIIRAAAEVFDESGFSGASMNKIVRRAETTMGAMYFHFASKEEIAQTVMNEQAADLTFPDGEDGLQRLLDINLEVAHQMRTNVLFRAGVRLAVEQGDFGMRDAAPYQLWTELFREQLEAAARRGELLPGVDTAEFAEILVGAYTGTQLMSNIATGRENLIERIATLWRYLLPSIASPEVIARLDLTGRAAAARKRAMRAVEKA